MTVLGPFKAKIAEVQKTRPPAFEIHLFYDRSGPIERAIHTFARNFGEGTLLVVEILLLMLSNSRRADRPQSSRYR